LTGWHTNIMKINARNVHPATSTTAELSSEEKHSTSAFSESELAKKAPRATGKLSMPFDEPLFATYRAKMFPINLDNLVLFLWKWDYGCQEYHR
jgi:hypothetical protein